MPGGAINPLDAMLQGTKWGEFSINKLFTIENTLSFNKEKLTPGVAYDYVTRTSKNQGVLQKTGFVNKENINPAGNWSLGLLQMDFFYRENPWYAGQFIRKITPIAPLRKGAILYFSTLFNRLKDSLLSVLVREVDNIFLKTKIQLPLTAENNIDYTFIENFMHAIKVERLHEVKARHERDLATYLKAFHTSSEVFETSPEKSQEELMANLANIPCKSFEIGQLFTVVGTKSLDSNAIDFIDEGINFIGRTFENNGIQGKIAEREFPPNAPYTITATVIGDKYVKLQREPYYCSQNINKLTPNSKHITVWNERVAYFFCAHIQNFVSLYDGWSGYTLNDIKKHSIHIPINAQCEIDFDFIERFMEKLEAHRIREIKASYDKEYAAYEHVVG